MYDVECPYCGAQEEINHDDGYGFDEDKKHHQQCSKCGKIYIFITSINFYYEAEKANCLNGSEHDYSPTFTYPIKYTKMKCKVCEEKRLLTDSEMENIIIQKEKERKLHERSKSD